MKKFITKNKQKIIFYFILFLITTFFVIFNTLPIGGRYNNDDLRSTYAVELIKENQSYLFKNEFNDKFDTYGFIQPGHFINKDKLVFVNGSFGNILTLAPLYVVIDNIFFSNLIQIITFLFIGIATYLIFSLYLSINLSLLATIIILYNPLTLANLSIYFPDLTSLCILLIGFYFLLKGFNENNEKFKYVSVFILSFSVLFKINNIIILLPIFVYLLLKKYLNFKLIISTFFIFFLTFFPQLHFNNLTTGSPLEVSYTSIANVYSGQFGASKLEKKEEYQEAKNVFFHRLFYEYIIPQKTSKGYSILVNLKIIIIFMITICPLLFFLFFKSKNRKNSLFFGLTISIFLFSFLFYGNLGGGMGYGEMNIRASFFRYILFPLYLLIIFSLIIIFKEYYNKRIVKILLLFIFLSQLFYISSKYPFNMYVFGNFKQSFCDAGIEINKLIPTDSVVLTAGFDDGFLTMPGNNYHFFDYAYIPKDKQDEEIKKVVTKSLFENIPLFIYYVDVGMKGRGDNHLYDFEKKYNIEQLYKFNKHYYIYKINSLKNENIISTGF